MFPYILKLRVSIIFLIISVWVIPSEAVPSKDLLKNFKIISADKLEVKEKTSFLVGNVELEVSGFNVKAPNVLIETKSDKEKSKLVKFEEGVTLKSKDIFLDCSKMEIDLEKSLMLCHGNQEKKLFFKREDMEIQSNDLELKYLDKKIESVKFFKESFFKKEDMKINSERILYFPELKLVKVIDKVWMNYLTKEENGEVREINLYADLLSYKEDEDLITAYSTSYDLKTQSIIPSVLTSKGFYSEARILSLYLKKDEPELAILQGDAYARFEDKGLEGEELEVNISEKKLKALAGRPKTLIYSKKNF